MRDAGKPTQSQPWRFDLGGVFQIEELPLLLAMASIPTAQVTSPTSVSNVAVYLNRSFCGSLTPLVHRLPSAVVLGAEQEDSGARQPVASPRDFLPTSPGALDPKGICHLDGLDPSRNKSSTSEDALQPCFIAP